MKKSAIWTDNYVLWPQKMIEISHNPLMNRFLQRVQNKDFLLKYFDCLFLFFLQNFRYWKQGKKSIHFLEWFKISKKKNLLLFLSVNSCKGINAFLLICKFLNLFRYFFLLPEFKFKFYLFNSAL